MTPVEIMTSESQERMLAIVEPGALDAVREVCDALGGPRERRRDRDSRRPAANPRRARGHCAWRGSCRDALRERSVLRASRAPARGPGVAARRRAPPLLGDLRRGSGAARDAHGFVLDLQPVRPSALPEHGGAARWRRRRAPSCGTGVASERSRARPVDRLQPALVQRGPAHRHELARRRVRGERRLHGSARRRGGELPELRQSRARRGDVAALGVGRRDGRARASH